MSLRRRLLLSYALLLGIALGVHSVVVAAGIRRQAVRTARQRAAALSELITASGNFVLEVERRAEDLVGQQMLVQAALAAHLVDVAENFAHLPPEEISRRLKDVVARTAIDEFWITDEKGHAYLRNRDEIDFAFPDAPTDSGQAYTFRRLLESSDGQLVQRLMPREHDGLPFKYAGVSGVDAAKRRIVQVGYRAESLERLTEGLRPEQLALRVVGQSGILRIQGVGPDGKTFREVQPGRVVEAPEPVEHAATLVGVREALDTGDLVTLERGGRLLALHPTRSGDQPYVMLVTLSLDDVRAGTRRAVLAAAAAAAALLALGIVLSARISRRIAGPVRRLADEASEIGRGRFDHRVEVRGDREVVELAEAFNRMTVSLQRHAEDLRRATAEKERLETELKIAAEVQTAMLPRALPERPGLEVAARSEPARVVGGDFYDFIELPDGRLAFALGDASGKGLPAALFAAECLSITRTLARLAGDGASDAAKILARANGVILDSGDVGELFATVCLGILDPRTGEVVVANAGHPSPVLLRGGEPGRALSEEGSFPLGIAADFSASLQTVTLRPGDTLVMYSDGITDAVDEAGECYAQSRLDECLLRCRGESAEEVVRHVHESVRGFAGGAEQRDDMTLLALRVV